MDKLTAQTAAVGAFVLSLFNMLGLFGAHLPAWLGQPVLSAVNVAALAIAGAIAAVKHALEAKR